MYHSMCFSVYWLFVGSQAGYPACMGERQSQLKSGAGSLLKVPPNKDSKTLVLV